ncbi:MAG: NUDIX hydrolase [Chloroflexi bacterium]|nr:NUDIX hydrolase [Chloroflexota bacterium]
MSQVGVTYQHPKSRRPISIGAGAVIIHEGRVLLVRNLYGVTKGRYLLPAGRVKPGELPDVTAARETFEETGLQVEIEGLLGVRIWVMEDGEHNYFYMFRAKLLSPPSDLQPNLNEIDDARFFTREEMDALAVDQTWAGAIAIAYKALEPGCTVWPNDAGLSSDSGVDTPEKWRMWM